jgi:hypothetical protein
MDAAPIGVGPSLNQPLPELRLSSPVSSTDSRHSSCADMARPEQTRGCTCADAKIHSTCASGVVVQGAGPDTQRFCCVLIWEHDSQFLRPLTLHPPVFARYLHRRSGGPALRLHEPESRNRVALVVGHDAAPPPSQSVQTGRCWDAGTWEIFRVIAKQLLPQ